MGSSIVHYKGKIYVYGGADPLSAVESTAGENQHSVDMFDDMYSYDIQESRWTQLDQTRTFNEAAHGVMLASAVRLEFGEDSSDGVFFSGGCDSTTGKCQFDKTLEVLLDQPEVHYRQEIKVSTADR